MAGYLEEEVLLGIRNGTKISRANTAFNITLWIRPAVFMALFISLLTFLVTTPSGIRMFFVPGLIFLLLLSLLTIAYVSFGAIVMVKNRDRISLKTLSLLAVLPIVRDFAYVCGMFLGFYRGRIGSIKPSWKRT